MNLSNKTLPQLRKELKEIDRNAQISANISTNVVKSQQQRPNFKRPLSSKELQHGLGLLHSLEAPCNKFQNVHISRLACSKILEHTMQGGNVEVMGMLIGNVSGNTFFVSDSYALPVEGTETRVNAQLASYEYMVNYLNELHKDPGMSTKSVIGWYHSHPGYDCWLSAIDMQTQDLNQKFQDPFVAIVVDPHKSLKDSDLAIGAFRTFSEDSSSNDPKDLSTYELELTIFESQYDNQLKSNDLKFKAPISDEVDTTLLLESLIDNMNKWNNLCKCKNEIQNIGLASESGNVRRPTEEPLSENNPYGTRSASMTSIDSALNTSDVDMESLQMEVIGSPSSSVNTFEQGLQNIRHVAPTRNPFNTSRDSFTSFSETARRNSQGIHNILIDNGGVAEKMIQTDYEKIKQQIILNNLKDYIRLREYRDIFNFPG